MTDVTVGTNDAADATGDLIVTFVDVTGTQGVTTDGTRTALPGASWGCYLVAPSISPQSGSVVTLTDGAATSARWESCSLIYQPPPHAATLYTASGSLGGSGGVAGNPKYPPQAVPVAGETDAAGSATARARTSAVAAGNVAGAATVAATTQARVRASAALGGGGGFSGDFSILHQSANLWFVSGACNGAGSFATGQIRLRARLASEIDPIGGVRGNATTSPAFNPQQYAIGSQTDGAGSIRGDAKIGHQYFVASRSGAAGGVIPFGGNAPLRVTNWVRNPRPEGAIIGVVDGVNNPGPTDWWLLYANPAFSWDSGNISVTQQGTESGIPFVDLLYNNTAPAGWVSLQTDGGIAATPGLVWSYSVFVRLSSGSLANVSSIQLQFLTDGTTVFYTGPSITPTSASLTSQWFHWDGVTINDPGMTNISAGMVINTSGGAVNMTLRIGGPKAEKAVAASGPQYLVVPQVGLVPNFGGSTTYVY